MSKITSTLGPLRGRTGNLVFSKTKTGNVVRQYQPEVKNPRSNAQIMVRAKMPPAAAVYRQLKQILDHSFNRTSPMLSHNEFMRYALKADIWPYLQKGYIGVPVPGRYRVTKGYLNRVTTQVSDASIVTRIAVPTEITPEGIAAMPENQGMCQLGDQLTYIMFGIDTLGEFHWFYNRFGINAGEELPSNVIGANGYLTIKKPDYIAKILAGVCIRTSVVNGQFVYSPEQFELLEDDYVDMFMTDDQLANMMTSYGVSTTSASSDKYLDELAGDQPTTGTTSGVDIQQVTVYVRGKNKDARVYCVVRNSGRYLLGIKSNSGDIWLCDKNGLAIVFNGERLTLNQVAWETKFAGYWEYRKLAEGELPPIPPVPFFVLKGENVDKYLHVVDGKVMKTVTTAIAKATHVALGEQVEVEGVNASYIIDADTLQRITFEIDTDVFDPLVLRSGVVGIASGESGKVFNQLRIDPDSGDTISPNNEGTAIVYEEVNNE